MKTISILITKKNEDNQLSQYILILSEILWEVAHLTLDVSVVFDVKQVVRKHYIASNSRERFSLSLSLESQSDLRNQSVLISLLRFRGVWVLTKSCILIFFSTGFKDERHRHRYFGNTRFAKSFGRFGNQMPSNFISGSFT